VHGQFDELVPFADGQALYAAYAGPKWHWWVKNATHYNVRQRHHQEYLQRLRAFVEGCLAACDANTAVDRRAPALCPQRRPSVGVGALSEMTLGFPTLFFFGILVCPGSSRSAAQFV